MGNKQKFRFFFDFFRKESAFNYIYFGFFASCLLLLNMYHLTSIPAGTWAAKIFFVAYGIGETIFEISLFVLVAMLLREYTKRFIYYFYIGFTFIFLFSQVIEFLLVKIMDISMIEAFDVVFGADFANFIELLYLSDIGISAWIGVFIVAIVFPILGIVLYRLSSNLAKKKPISFKQRYLFHSLIILPVLLLTIDLSLSSKVICTEFGKFKRALPWKGTFLNEKAESIKLAGPIKHKKDQALILGELDKQDIQKGFKPNIYLFVAESLREDFITPISAPNLSEFKSEGISSTVSLSNANGTNFSWFSIFHSQYPFYWAYRENHRWKDGSLPLNVLKRMGYKIHVYTSAQLKYYKLDEVILGKDQKLATTFKEFTHYGDKPAWKSDEETINAFMDDFDHHHEREGNVYIVFLDSTHFNYSWPDNFPEKFQPANDLNWSHRLSSNPLKLIEVKNRYRNSIAYVDSLFAKCTDLIKKKGMYDDSVIVFTGDHGEEFKEEGKLFHASNLNIVQTSVPIYYKLGAKKYECKKKLRLSSHVDIFPTIIHHVDESERFTGYFDGHSIMSDKKPQFTYVARYNSCNHPYEFYLHNGFEHVVFRFSRERSVFRSKSLKILGLHQGLNTINITKDEALHRYSRQLNAVFNLKD
ncbi:MAG: hypothetical protein S4CHLAM37_16300 [Chlamydiia bacterium]|nr:hypothetical protein [Chlamydiia bacterium]